jgi:hypothetical protein
MANWKVKIDTLVSETMALANRRPPTVDPADAMPNRDTLLDKAVTLANQVVKEETIEPTGIPTLAVQREQISRRLKLFRAHQQRLAKDREDYASSMVNRMRHLGSSAKEAQG